VLKFIAHRVVLLVPVLLIVTVLVSLLIYFTPGDPVRVMLGLRANEEAVAAIRAELGLDKPLYVRYFKWLGNIVRGNLGRSLQRNEDIGGMILARLPATLELTIFALWITAIIAIPLGVISAVKANTLVDNLCSFFSLFWVAMPGFWIALIALLFFSAKLHLFPISGRLGPIWTTQGLWSLLLPGLILGLRQVAIVSRLIRAGMLDVLNEEYIRTARGKGLSERVVIYRHALRNSMIPTVTIFGVQIPELLSVSVILEIVFAWPGLGMLLVDAVFKRDYTLVQSIVLVYSVLVIVVNVLVDTLYAYIDPRIKYE
jgi:peptide/nickel transport system permease protein